MEDFLAFIKRNGYYLMLAVGVIALGALVVSYNRKMELTDKVMDLQEDQEKIQLVQDEEDMLVAQDTNTEEDFQQEVISNNVELDVPSAPADQKNETMNVTQEETEEQTMGDNSTGDNSTGDATTEKKKELHFDTNNPMAWPVVGNVILPFSMDATVYYVTLDQYKTNPGILIQTIEGTEVSPGAEGEVISVQEESGYGMVVTIDLGDGYIAKYGQLKDVCVEEGQRVNANTVIGLAASPSSFFKKEGCHVFFQLNKDEVPQNPMEYLE
ncbi:MAG: M23 family metallopeptidase [Lachnospiraceae bacterium]|nr:M23 family metallopeptidase [Lachnospiraceae bacterium]